MRCTCMSPHRKKITIRHRISWYGAVLIIWAVSMLWFGRHALAEIVWYEHAIGLPLSIVGTESVHTNMQLGNYFFSHDHYDLNRAQKHYKKVIEADPFFKGAHYQLGRTYFVTGNLTQAMRNVDIEMIINPQLGKTHYMRGLIAGFQKKLNLAGTEFFKFIKTDSANWAGYNDLAWILFQQGRFSDAQQVVEIGLGYTPNNAWLLNSYGTVLLAQKKGAEAKPILEKSKTFFGRMQPSDWGEAYPGNSPNVLSEGLEASIQATERNIMRASTHEIKNTDQQPEDTIKDFTAPTQGSLIPCTGDECVDQKICVFTSKPDVVFAGTRAVVSWDLQNFKLPLTCTLEGRDANGALVDSRVVITPKTIFPVSNTQTVPVTQQLHYILRCASTESGLRQDVCTSPARTVSSVPPPLFEK